MARAKRTRTSLIAEIATLRARVQDLETCNRGKDTFLANLSHELRTPLSPVLMSISALEMRQLPRDLHDEIAIVRRNVELAVKLMDDLLDLTRTSRGKIELNLQVVDAFAIIQQTVKVCAAEAAAKSLQLSLDVRPGCCFLRADPDRLEQVFWNLIKNAVKFTPPGGRVEIHCSAKKGNRIEIQVKDSGVGIEPELLPRLFNPFEQGGRETTQRFGGLGLGLTISHRLVELHGGELLAHSEGRGRGATFTVRLPAQAPPLRAEVAPCPPAAEIQQRLHILLVEDHADTARIMKNLLESFGHHVRTAGSVAAALQLAQEEDFDLVIGDLGLPDGSGLEMMRELARLHNLQGIAISGYGMQEDIERSRQAGFLEHIVKPIDVHKLEELIRRVSRRVLHTRQVDRPEASR